MQTCAYVHVWVSVSWLERQVEEANQLRDESTFLNCLVNFPELHWFAIQLQATVNILKE